MSTRPARYATWRPALAAALALLALTAVAHANAQQAPDPPSGLITGTLVRGSDATLDLDALTVELIAVTPGGEVTSQRTTTSAGRFRFDAAADSALTYVLRATVEGVDYFAPAPVLLSTDLPTADVEIPVYPSTTEAPALHIEATTVTILALDRAAQQLTMVREDRVVNPSQATYVGDESGITLRLPLPDATVDAGGSATYGDIPIPGTFAVDGATLASQVPLRPGETRLLTQYTVGYEAAADRYRLRVTTPLDADRMAVRVPQRFVEALLPVEAATPGAREQLEGETLLVLETEGPSAPGRSIVADLRGLSGRLAANPLTEPEGAAIAALVSVGVIAAGALLASRLRARRADRAP